MVMLVIPKIIKKPILLKIYFFLLINSLIVKGSKIKPAKNHLKKFKEKGGISYMLAAFPTIKLPDQKSVVKSNNRYARLLFFFTRL